MRLGFAVWCSLRIEKNLFMVPTANSAFAQLLDPGALCYSAPQQAAGVDAFHSCSISDALLIMSLGVPSDTPHEPC